MAEPTDDTPASQDPPPETASPSAAERPPVTSTLRRSRFAWAGFLVQPFLLLVAGTLLIIGLGLAQRVGWISAGGGGSTGGQTAVVDSNTRYICPMMCTPPQSEPGRCPVCAMELVPATTSGGGDGLSIEVDPVARRVAGIQTVAVKAVPLVRTIRTIGEISFDEGALTTISAYVDGRIDRLYADYIGVVVKKGDHLALLYSPEIYAAQVELLQSKQALAQIQTGTLPRVIRSQQQLYDGARQKLLELGMVATQLQELERSGKASFRIHLWAPASGTVIAKLAEEGTYIKTGTPIYRLADLSTVWLMLKLFPDDVAAIRYGQKVTAEVQSLPGKQFTGRVAFVDPVVDPKTRTVGVRVVFANPKGMLRIGDYAKAQIEVAVTADGDPLGRVYDPELAGKWISPRHPHVIQSAPGPCPVCGIALVPASEFGFSDQPTQQEGSLVVPRNAVLMAGAHSVVYVEKEPGRFEIRPVVLGLLRRDQAVILKGVKEGEQVAVKGNFLLDSQMQLAGNPSLIDPTRLLAKPARDAHASEGDQGKAEKHRAALATLSAEDRLLAERQVICPVTGLPLGSMGTPPKVDVNGRTVFLCCEGCRARLLADPEKYLAKLPAEAAQ
jgi:Cu(I)/Ag(I) efflux system membrane fusion protein